MKRIAALCAVTVLTVLGSFAAQAQPYYHHHRRVIVVHHHDYHHRPVVVIRH
jgi:hypothetical protein